MGLFDSVMAKANALAADAERAGKVAAAQARIVALQNDVRKAERELGKAAYALIEQGEPLHPDLEAAAVTLLEAHEALREKESEIAALRGEPGQAAGQTFVTYPAAAAAAGAADPAGAAAGEADLQTAPAGAATPAEAEAEVAGQSTVAGPAGDDTEPSPADDAG
jgi:hypothetical protein